MTPEQQRAIEHDAAKPVLRFFHHLDAGEYDRLVALMAPDGVWHRQGKELRGRDAIMEAMRARPAGLLTQHNATNLVVDAVDADHATATVYLTVFAHTPAAGAKGPGPVELPNLVGIYREKLVRTAEGWRIAEITSQPMMRR